jgi:hypothetical protein
MAKRKRHTAAQIVRKLEDADRRPTGGPERCSGVPGTGGQ